MSHLPELLSWYCIVMISHHNSFENQVAVDLTHPPPDKMTPIFADDIFKCIFMNEKFCFVIRNLLKFVTKGPFDYKLAVVQVVAWHRTGNKPLPEALLTQFPDEYMRHAGEMS